MGPFFVLLAIVLSVSGADQCGNRPVELINSELQCSSDIKDTLVERIEQKAKGFFERAKQELGIKSENKREPRKCEYYKCIFDRLGMLNQLDLPDWSLMHAWINAHVDEENRERINGQISSCFRLLATSALNVQNNCETTSSLMMCLHSSDKCELFSYP